MNTKKAEGGKSPKPVVIPPKKVSDNDDKSNANKAPKDLKVSDEKNGNVATVMETDKSNEKSAPSPAPTPAPTPAPKPTRALNDPRYKNE